MLRLSDFYQGSSRVSVLYLKFIFLGDGQMDRYHLFVETDTEAWGHVSVSSVS